MKNINELKEKDKLLNKIKEENRRKLVDLLKEYKGNALTETEIEAHIGKFEPFKPSSLYSAYEIDSRYFDGEYYYWLSPNWIGAIFLLFLLIFYLTIIILEIL